MAEINYGFLTGQPDPTMTGGAAKALNVAVFTPETKPGTTLSRLITVSPGKVFFFRAFNIPEDRSISFQAVSLGVGELPGGGGRDLYIQPMTLGGADKWTLTPGNPQLLLRLPGVYRLLLSDEDMLGELWVEYLIWEQFGPIDSMVVR